MVQLAHHNAVLPLPTRFSATWLGAVSVSFVMYNRKASTTLPMHFVAPNGLTT